MINGKFENENIEVFMDTGSSPNLISLSKYKEKFSNLEIKQEETPSLAGIIPHLKINTIGFIDVPIQLASKLIYLKTIVADNVYFNGDILLGISSMSDFNILIHPREKGIYIDDEFLPFLKHSVNDYFLNKVDSNKSDPGFNTQNRKKKGILKHRTIHI